jgi:hypothetical protein
MEVRRLVRTSTIAAIVRRVGLMASDRKTDLPPSDGRSGTCPWRPCSDHWRDDVKKREVIGLGSLAPSTTAATEVISTLRRQSANRRSDRLQRRPSACPCRRCG